MTCDSFDVYYLSNSGLGTISATATGGTAATANTSTTPGYGIAKITAVAGSAGVGNSVTISGSGGAVYVLGIEPFLSTTATVRIANVGVAGSTTANWADTSPWASVQAVEAYAPDLTIIELSTNDAITAISSSVVQANLAAIIQAAQLSGDVIILTPPPNQAASVLGYQQQYVGVMQSLATLYNAPVVDVFNRWSQTYQMAIMFDGNHPNNLGYWDMAAAVSELIRQLL